MMHFLFFTFIAAVTFREGSTTSCTDINLEDDATVITSLDLSVSCGTTGITVEIDTCALQQMFYNVSTDFALVGFNASVTGFDHSLAADSSCRGTEPDSETLQIITSFYDCVTDMTDNGTHIHYSNAIRTIDFSYTGSSLAVRRKDILLPFCCTYSKLTNESSSIMLTPSIGINQAPKVISHGVFSITVDLCKDETCTTSYGAGEAVVALVDVIYVVITTTHTDLIIDALDIWATKTNNADDPNYHMLLDDGCPVDHPYVTVDTNRVGERAAVSFTAFDWVDESPNMYIHVAVSTCDNTRDEACIIGRTCMRRRRRDVQLTGVMGETVTSTAGHLTITH